jgi:uncharacterized repeat protein (TIGR01451 family)
MGKEVGRVGARISGAVLPRAVVLAALLAGLAVAAPGSAFGAGSGYFVTFVARSCPSYSDVYANKARNDIQESLNDLGPDSPYNSNSAALVSPVFEGRPPQTACSPLPNWQFTLGHNYQSMAVRGPWGNLSKVTDPFPSSIVTQASTPLYNGQHQQVDGLSIPGAVTIQLTDDERQQASTASQLWAQGGTPDDPVLAQPFPGPQYGFAALRCATDALNGDNVEYIYFPAGVTHVFCYAFYVVPPPTSGTITIEKRVVGAPAGQNPSFAFGGSISYDPNGFTLADGQSKDFYRAGGQTWDVTEGAVDNYVLSSVACSAQTASGGAGSSTATVTGSTTTIQLVANEHETCVYTNRYQQPVGGLTIDKITRGGVGTFGYTVSPSGGGADRHVAATTHNPGVPATAQPTLTDLAPGQYTITESPPTSDAGRWTTVSITCEGVKQDASKPIKVTVTSGQSTECSFLNVFIPAGSISLAKITTGHIGAVAFLVASETGAAAQYHQLAVTTHQGVAANAVPVRPASSTQHLPLGRYVIVESAPPSENPQNWTLQYVQCNGQLVPFNRGTIAVTLTPAQPRMHCVFTDHFNPHPPPPPPTPTPPGPSPSPSPNPDVPTYPMTDLKVTKFALAPVAVEGMPLSYRINVHNNGPDTAANVVLADKPAGKATIVSVRPSAGQCTVGKFVVCRLGNIKAGANVSIMLTLTPETTDSPFINRAVAGGSTAESTLANNLSHSTLRLIHGPANPVACSARRGPVAHPAC